MVCYLMSKFWEQVDGPTTSTFRVGQNDRAMGRQNAPFIVNKRDFRTLHLTHAQSAPQLTNRLHNAEETSCRASMRVRDHPAMCIERKCTAPACMTAAEESPTLARFQK